ncbi:MAG: hypothetical protein MRJ68_10960 [Nitrospira sp.]|nr:hypothetical protein [Nitrospira sp.]
MDALISFGDGLFQAVGWSPDGRLPGRQARPRAHGHDLAWNASFAIWVRRRSRSARPSLSWSDMVAEDPDLFFQDFLSLFSGVTGLASSPEFIYLGCSGIKLMDALISFGDGLSSCWMVADGRIRGR